jgi:hypothetical protein
MKKILTALAALTVIATPTFAQSFSVSPYRTGNVWPFTYQPVAPQNERIATRRNVLQSFAKVPGPGPAVNPNSPAATGGGSLGYNEKLLIY